MNKKEQYKRLIMFLASALILLPASAQALPPASVRQQIVVGQVFVQASLPACHWRSWLAFPASPTFLSLQVFLFVPVPAQAEGYSGWQNRRQNWKPDAAG